MSVRKYSHVSHKTKQKIGIAIGIAADRVTRVSEEDLKTHALKSGIAHALGFVRCFFMIKMIMTLI